MSTLYLHRILRFILRITSVIISITDRTVRLILLEISHPHPLRAGSEALARFRPWRRWPASAGLTVWVLVEDPPGIWGYEHSWRLACSGGLYYSHAWHLAGGLGYNHARVAVGGLTRRLAWRLTEELSWELPLGLPWETSHGLTWVPPLGLPCEASHGLSWVLPLGLAREAAHRLSRVLPLGLPWMSAAWEVPWRWKATTWARLGTLPAHTVFINYVAFRKADCPTERGGNAAGLTCHSLESLLVLGSSLPHVPGLV